MEKNKDFFALEAGSGLFEASDSSIGRITQDLSGKTWKMEKMRVGQGVSEGIQLECRTSPWRCLYRPVSCRGTG